MSVSVVEWTTTAGQHRYPVETQAALEALRRLIVAVTVAEGCDGAAMLARLVGRTRIVLDERDGVLVLGRVEGDGTRATEATVVIDPSSAAFGLVVPSMAVSTDALSH